MPINENQNQWEKLFQHLNYCISVLKKSLDNQKIEILKRVQHDIEILQKYIKSIMKYNEKRQKQIGRLVTELKKKDQKFQVQNSQIIQLNKRIHKKQEELLIKQGIIEHLKYSKRIDASYASSILVNGNQSILQRKIGGLQKNKKSVEEEVSSIDGLCLSQYSELYEQQKPQKSFFQTQTTQASTKSEIRSKQLSKRPLICGIINEQEQNPDQKSCYCESKQLHKTQSLIFAD